MRWCVSTAPIRCLYIEAHGAARRREPTYSVRFDAADLWQDGQRDVWVHVDLWDSYLEGS